MSVVQESGKQAQRKAVMTVLAHSDAAEIAERMGALAMPAHENLREPENGRDGNKAQMIALCDAMVQSDEFAGSVETKVVAPLRAVMEAKRQRKTAEAAATRVDFYTLVRGEG